MRQRFAALLLALLAHGVSAQASACTRDLAVSTLVGAGLGGAAIAIPATVVHRHDQNASHLMVELAIPAGAVLGFAAARRDRPCAAPRDSNRVAQAVVSTRASHARAGALVGGVAGAIAGAVGSTFLNVGCRDGGSCSGTRVAIGVAMAAEGGVAFGVLGGLIGWAVPAGGSRP